MERTIVKTKEVIFQLKIKVCSYAIFRELDIKGWYLPGVDPELVKKRVQWAFFFQFRFKTMHFQDFDPTKEHFKDQLRIL